nr:hypothetical protein [Tanacetum cinerariifolium]
MSQGCREPGDGDDEPSDDDNDDDTDDEDPKEEPFKDEEYDEEEEHPALADSPVVPIVDPDEIFDKLMEIAPTTLEGVNERVTKLDTTIRQRTDEFEIRFEEAQDDQALLRARVNTLIDYPNYVTANPVDYITWTHRDIRG